jgi:hypothetical protein
MPQDITFCSGADCPIKENCLRNTAVIYGRSSYFGQIPYDFDLKKCDHFMDDRPNEDKIKSLAYHIWESNGRLNGTNENDWFRAYKQLLFDIRNN